MSTDPPDRWWSGTHQEVAEYLAVRGVPVQTIATVLGKHPNTVHKHLSLIHLLRSDYRATLIRNCREDLAALGVDPEEAVRKALEGFEP